MRVFSIVLPFLAAVCVLASPLIRDTQSSIVSILTDLSNTLTPFSHQLLYATPQNATKENLTPIINNMYDAVTTATSNLKLLQGQTAKRATASTDDSGASEVYNVAAALADNISLIFQAANAVLSAIEEGDYTIVSGLLTTLGKIALELVSVVVSLVTGLGQPLITLVQPLVSIITSLGLGSLLGSLIPGLL